jgi:hypothetical protein
MNSIQPDITNHKCQKLVEKLILSRQKTQNFFQDIPEDDWYQQIYTEGAKWTVHQVLAHFVATEAAITRLIKYILRGNPGVPKNFDIDAFNEREVHCLAKLPNVMIMQRFEERRDETIKMVEDLNDDDLLKEGRHPWLGVVPIEEMIKLMYRHNQIHQRDIRKTLAS